MSIPPFYGRAAFSPDVIRQVEAVLKRAWDANGELIRAAEVADPHDYARPRTLTAYATAVCALLGAGGSEAQVCGYLRREEEALLGAARTIAQERGAIAGAAWRIVRGVARPEDL